MSLSLSKDEENKVERRRNAAKNNDDNATQCAVPGQPIKHEAESDLIKKKEGEKN
jgi:hypothetical protein